MKERDRNSKHMIARDIEEADATMVIDPGIYQPGTGVSESGAPDPSDIPGYALVVNKGQQAGRTWLLSPGFTNIGRNPYSDITLDHITVSRHHCRIELGSSGLSVKDLGSTNGTYVNDRLAEETSLIPGDRLMIGMFHLLVAWRQ